MRCPLWYHRPSTNGASYHGLHDQKPRAKMNSPNFTWPLCGICQSLHKILLYTLPGVPLHMLLSLFQMLLLLNCCHCVYPVSRIVGSVITRSHNVCYNTFTQCTPAHSHSHPPRPSLISPPSPSHTGPFLPQIVPILVSTCMHMHTHMDAHTNF